MSGANHIQPPARRSVLDVNEWFAYACQLEGENRRLIDMVVTLLAWTVQRDELHGFARDLADERWPQAA